MSTFPIRPVTAGYLPRAGESAQAEESTMTANTADPAGPWVQLPDMTFGVNRYFEFLQRQIRLAGELTATWVSAMNTLSTTFLAMLKSAVPAQPSARSSARSDFPHRSAPVLRSKAPEVSPSPMAGQQGRNRHLPTSSMRSSNYSSKMTSSAPSASEPLPSSRGNGLIEGPAAGAPSIVPVPWVLSNARRR